MDPCEDSTCQPHTPHLYLCSLTQCFPPYTVGPCVLVTPFPEVVPVLKDLGWPGDPTMLSAHLSASSAPLGVPLCLDSLGTPPTCNHTYMCTAMHPHTCTHTYAQLHHYTDIHNHLFTHNHAHISIHNHTHAHVHSHSMHNHVYTHAFTYTHTQALACQVCRGLALLMSG